jgi:hypothetical protein
MTYLPQKYEEKLQLFCKKKQGSCSFTTQENIQKSLKRRIYTKEEAHIPLLKLFSDLSIYEKTCQSLMKNVILPPTPHFN